MGIRRLVEAFVSGLKRFNARFQCPECAAEQRRQRTDDIICQGCADNRTW